MPRDLRFALAVTDSLFLVYWLASALHQAGVLALPADWLYAHADQPAVIAWNWSFFPLDLAFSLTGLSAVAAERRGSSLWRPLALISLTLTVVAGGMAVGYWGLIGEFNPSWFLPNLALVLWPMLYLPRLVREIARLTS